MPAFLFPISQDARDDAPLLIFVEMMHIKEKLHQLCVQYAEQRIRTAQEAIISAKESSEGDTKSSAGDKYETGREMMQQEITRNEQQLQESKKLLHAMSLIPARKPYSTAVPGALVVTDKETFYIAISAGLLEHEGRKYFSISGSSPIGIKLKGLQAGDTFSFNQKEFRILEIF
ncbi:MAG TPA: 3-oxoacyl-ACP synthase [Sphingobacteriaceae bacterium]